MLLWGELQGLTFVISHPLGGINIHSEKDFVIHGVCDYKVTYWTGLDWLLLI